MSTELTRGTEMSSASPLGPFWVSRCIPSSCIVLFDYYVMSFLGAIKLKK